MSNALEERGFVEVETSYGRLRGVDKSGIKVFKGIPYGGSTAGRGRFRPPTPPASWTGVRDALEFGATAPQTKAEGGYARLIGWDRQPPMGEDCLVLNVWTPALDGARRPVLFSIHGGGFTSGSGSMAGYNGDPLARTGDVVVVTMNHRIGVLGSLNLADLGAPEEFARSGGVGMLDLVAALEWVRDNIERFGGDPSNVTAFGQSGGGAKTAVLLAMPAARGLFHRAGVQSGSALRMAQRKGSMRSAEALLAHLGIERERAAEALQQVPIDRLIEAQGAIARKDPRNVFWPVVDGTTLPTHPFDPKAPELSADIPMIIGTTLDDSGIRTGRRLEDPGLVGWCEKTFGARAQRIVEAYRKHYPEAPAHLLQARMLTDRGARRAASTMAERKAALGRAPAYLYLFTWPSPAMDGQLGAIHGVDVGLTFNNTRGAMVGDSPAMHTLAERYSRAWVAFARSGNPSHAGIPEWPAFDPETRPTMVFDEHVSLESDPLRDLRALWEDETQ